VISLQTQFLFVHIPKTAGNAIQSVLSKYSEDIITKSFSHQDGIERFNVISPKYKLNKHATILIYRHEIEPQVYKKLFKFCVVRNPWDRVISNYIFHKQRPQLKEGTLYKDLKDVKFDKKEFKKFIYKVKPLEFHVLPIQYYTLPKTNCVLKLASKVRTFRKNPLCFSKIDYYLRFENLQNDFNILCKLLDIPSETLPVRNKSKHINYTAYYDAEAYQIVRNLFKNEIDFFNYSFSDS